MQAFCQDNEFHAREYQRFKSVQKELSAIGEKNSRSGKIDLPRGWPLWQSDEEDGDTADDSEEELRRLPPQPYRC